MLISAKTVLTETPRIMCTPWLSQVDTQKIFFLAALGLDRCAPAFSSCGEQGLLFIVVRGLLIAVASLVVEHRL